MTAAIHRYVSAGVLAIWGVVLTYFYVTDRIGSYLHPAFHPWTIASGVVLMLMAVGTLFLPQEEHECGDHDVPQTPPPDDHWHVHEPGGGCCGHDHAVKKKAGACGHDHGGTKVRILPALILTVPLLVAATVSPSQFGAAVVMNRGYVQDINDLPGFQPYTEPALPTEDGSVAPVETTPSSAYLPRNAAGQITAQTVDLLYAAEEPTMRGDFDGKEVEMIGQYMPAKEKNAAGNRFNLVRMFVMCCAADARPVAVSVETQTPMESAEMTWVKVIGKATFPLEGGRRIPVVVAQSITPCDPPPESFIY